MSQERARFVLKCLLSEVHDFNSDMNEWEETFVSDLGQRLEANPDLQLTPKQVNKLEQIFRSRNN